MSQTYPVAIVKVSIRKNRSFIFMLRDPFSNPRKWLGTGLVRAALTDKMVFKKPLKWGHCMPGTRMAIEACEGPLLDFLWVARGSRLLYRNLMESRDQRADKFTVDDLGLFGQASSVSIPYSTDTDEISSMALKMSFEMLRVKLRVSIACNDYEVISVLESYGQKPEVINKDGYLDPFGFDLGE